MDALLRRRSMIASGGGTPPTPPTPTFIPFVRGGVGSYIDTGITADDSTRVIVWARNFNPNSIVLFGSRIGGTDKAYGVFAPGLQYSGSIRFDYGSTQNYVNDAFTKMSGYHKYELNGANFYIDDVLVGSATAQTFENLLNIFLFSINTNGTINDSSMPIDICACKIYKGGNLVRDFSPVQSPSVGLYDEVSDTVFTNSGTGSFTYGEFASNAYTPLEYIECDKQQYFDSGVYGSENIKVVSKFRMTSTDKKFSRLFGCRNSDNSIMCELMVGTEGTANKSFDMRYSGANNSVYNNTSQTGNDLVFSAIGNSFALYKNNSSLGTKTGAAGSFTTPYTMYVGASNVAGEEQLQYSFYGRIYYISLDAQHSYVPAKVNNVAGMYDTYNDVFHPSESATPFIAGPALN